MKLNTLFGSAIVLNIAIMLVIGISWCVNLYKFTQCDFEPSWKGEIIHGIGLIPVVSVVTAWSDAK